ncbi:hypothetical protein HRI_004051800 [Hibiscus trionum]|uniref:Uncharacterized protein n=1 Tax=Hibiscus trionum TaxID=183268 RepID=A0A9W7IXQ3_HIBTR|nr:hypothetical protein HRI_004051800 [Hibiscus trionum]
MGELEFQQRWDWELRRNKDDGLDSSFGGLKSSSEPLLKKHKPVPSLILVDDDDDDETNRFEPKNNGNPGAGDHINIGKARKCKTRNLSNKLKRDCPENNDTCVHVADPLDELKSMMESLLKDLKVTKEDVLKWMLEEMKKLVSDYTCPEPKRQRQGHGRKKIHLQQMKKSKKFEDQHENPHKESMQFRHPKNSETCIQVQHNTNFREPVQIQGIVGAAGSTDYFNAAGDGAESQQVTKLITSSKRIKGDTLPKSANAYLQASPDQNVKVLRGHESVVLAIEAQKGKGGSLKRNAKGKKAVDCGDHHQVSEDQGGHCQAMATAVTTSNGEKLGLSGARYFLPTLPGQPPLSTEPIVASATQGLDASFFNYIQASSNQGSFQGIQADERTRGFALMGSKNMGSLDLNSPSAASIGNGFSVPFQQPIDVGSSITREINPQYLSKENGKQLSLMMNGGSYNLSEIIASNNHHCFMSYQMQNFKDGHLFRQ